MKLMNNKLKSFIKKQTTLPSAILDLPVITITGSEIAIEQYYKLISFSDQQIKLQCENGIIQIKGQKLSIKMMYAREIILEGVIEEVVFQK